ncbi:glycoside hydrolase family 88 protein [Parabacteroides sp. AF17-28]|uniref:glycoside hydrolase family 88/105 protein n=1 Tax=Parabacteroides sp. AF17-28 TaxID=2292241 RepID=UPI001314A71F|nr:glycoside hydrolase family 88 protein [Parabacteroides sp. AF17-28]
MNIRCLFVGVLLLIPLCGMGQEVSKEDVLSTICRVADHVIQQTTYRYYDQANGVQIDDLSRYGYNKYVVPQNGYNDWKYWNGVIHIGFNALGKVTGNEKYQSYTKKNFEFFFKDRPYLKSIYKGNDQWHFPVAQGINITQLDDCGAMGASLIELYENNRVVAYKEYIDMAADYIMYRQQRLDDGTFSRPVPNNHTVWADDLYMSVPFLIRMWKLTGIELYMEEAVNQIFLFDKHLYDEKVGLMWHCYYDDLKVNGGTYWGRCNGWMMVAIADLLRFLPENHSRRNEVIALLNRQIQNLAQYQSASGLWHQILNKEDSYLETSCSAMFVYSIALAINNGWVDKRYKTIALTGWNGLLTCITDEGAVTGICAGTGIGNDVKFYYDRPTPYNDIHGLGAMFLAGVEISKLLD